MNKEVQKYYSLVPDGSKPKLTELRAVVRSIIPSASETICYGVPTFQIDGKNVLGIAGWNDFVSIYPYGSDQIRKFNKELSGYKTSKGAVRLSLSQPIPKKLISKIVEDKLKSLGLN